MKVSNRPVRTCSLLYLIYLALLALSVIHVTEVILWVVCYICISKKNGFTELHTNCGVSSSMSRNNTTPDEWLDVAFQDRVEV
jgi:hypothetical protein